MPRRSKVLFLCVGNACRSQMAEAIAKHVAGDVIEPSSAGLVAFGQIAGPTITVLDEHGISAAGQHSKSLREDALTAADLVVNMTGRTAREIFRESRPATIEDWIVGDPFGFDLAIYRTIRDEIESRVEDLARRLREDRKAATTSKSHKEPEE